MLLPLVLVVGFGPVVASTAEDDAPTPLTRQVEEDALEQHGVPDEEPTAAGDAVDEPLIDIAVAPSSTTRLHFQWQHGLNYRLEQRVGIGPTDTSWVNRDLALSGRVLSSREEIRYRSRPESFPAPVLIDTSDHDTRRAFPLGLEFTVARRPLTLQAEYLAARWLGRLLVF